MNGTGRGADLAEFVDRERIGSTVFLTWKFLHVVAAIIWIGSGFALGTLNARMASSRDVPGLVALGRQGEFFGKAVFPPASIGTLLFGILMVVTSDGYAFSDPFISIGFVGVALSIVFGAVLTERASKALRERLDTAGASTDAAVLDDPEIGALQRQLGMYTVIDLAILLVTVWAMVVKPGS